MLQFVNQLIIADVLSGLNSAKDTILSAGKSILDIVAILGGLFCVGAFLFNLLAFVRVNRNGGDHGNELRNAIISLVIAILCASWAIWGSLMMG